MHYQVRHSNYLVLSFSHGKVDQKKTVAISQMFNHVQLCVHWMHLLNTRTCWYTYITPTEIYRDQDRNVISCSTLKVDSTVFKSGVLLIKLRHKILHSLSAQPAYV